MKHIIGATYKYPNSNKKFILSAVDEWVYIFSCGHRVSYCVFEDLIMINPNNQLQLIF